MQDGGMPEVSVDHGPTRRLSWTSVQLSDVVGPAVLPAASAQSCASPALPVTSAAPPPTTTTEPAAVASTSGPSGAVDGEASLATSPSVPQPDPHPDPQPNPPADPPPEPPPDHRPVPQSAPASQSAADALAARLRADSDDSGEVTVLGVALVANCHVSLVIFGLFFLAAGSLLCVIAFRAPTSATGDVQSRVAGTFFLCLAAVMCTFGLCLCRLDQQLSQRDQEKGAADCGDCYIHDDKSRCHRVLPSIRRARGSTQRIKRHMMRQLDERWMSAAGGRHKEKTFSSIELLTATSTESVGCGRCNEASSYGAMEKIDVASFPS